MRRSTLLVSVVVLVAVSGCSVGPIGAEPTPPRETVTPVQVPETASTDAPATPLDATAPPPGINSDGSVNLAEVARSHNRFLSNRSFTIRYRDGRRLPSGDGDVTVTNRTLTALVENDTTYHIRYLDESGSVETVIFGDETGRYRRTFANGTARTTVVSSSPQPINWRFSSGTFRLGPGPLSLSPEDVSVAPVARGGESLYRIHVPSTPDGLGWTDQTNYTATLYVTEDGLIRTLYVEYRTGDEGDGGPRSVGMRFSFVAVGETAVDRPDWVGEPRDGGTATQSPGSDGRTTSASD